MLNTEFYQALSSIRKKNSLICITLVVPLIQVFQNLQACNWRKMSRYPCYQATEANATNLSSFRAISESCPYFKSNLYLYC